jgi:hypothetical protein
MRLLRRKLVLIPTGIVLVAAATFVGLVLHAHAEYRYCVTEQVGPGILQFGPFHTQPASFRCSWDEWVGAE